MRKPQGKKGTFEESYRNFLSAQKGIEKMMVRIGRAYEELNFRIEAVRFIHGDDGRIKSVEIVRGSAF